MTEATDVSQVERLQRRLARERAARKQAEAILEAKSRELWQQREHYRALVENTSDVVLTTDLDDVVTWISDSVETLLGWTPAEVVGRRVIDLHWPEDHHLIGEAQGRLLAGETVRGDIRLLGADDEPRWVTALVRLIRDHRGVPSYHLVSWRDIDAEHDMRDVVVGTTAMARAHDLLRTVSDAMSDPLVLMRAVRDEPGHVVDVEVLEANEAAAIAFHQSRDDLVGAHLIAELGLSAADPLVAAVLQAIESKQPLIVDTTPVHNPVEDRHVYVDLRAIPVSGDRVAFTWRDVTEQAMARRRLARSEERFRALAELASDVMYETNLDGTVAWISGAVTRVLGYEVDDLIGRSSFELIDPRDAERVSGLRARVLNGTTVLDVPCRFRCADGTVLNVIVRSTPRHDDDGRVVGTSVGLRDVTAETKAVALQRISEERFRTAMAAAPNGMAVADRTNRFTAVNPALCTLLGRSEEALLGRAVDDFMSDGDRDEFRISDEELAASESGTITHEHRLRGHQRDVWVQHSMRALFDENGSVTQYVHQFMDTTEMRAAREALVRSETRFRLAIESAPTGMAVVDLDRRFVQVNPALCRLTGRDAEWLLAHGVMDILVPAEDVPDRLMRADLLASYMAVTSREQEVLRPDGTRVWVNHVIGVQREADGEPAGYVSQFIDMTQDRENRRLLQYLADHDAMTGLQNRRSVIDEITGILAHPVRGGLGMAVLFLDLDGFKPVNDTYGHAMGDALLAEVARRLTDATRRGDIVARLGGDEFLVFLSGLQEPEDAGRAAEKVRAAVAEPFRIDGQELHVTASIGVSRAAQGDSTDALILDADEAMYAAKRAGGDRVSEAPGA